MEPYDSLVPGQWTVVSTNTLKDLDPCPQRNCSYSAVEGVWGLVNDWCGGAFASGYGILGGLVQWGGGHNGYFGSEIYVFDLASQQWVRETDPYDDGSSSVASKCSADGIYPDGSACPTHTYNSIEYHPSTNRLVILNGTPDPVAGGAYDGRAHLFGFTTHAWSLGARTASPFGYDAPGAYDASRDVFWQMYGYVYRLAAYDPNLDEWHDYGSPGTWDIDGAGKVDPVRDLLVFIDARGTGKVYGISLASPSSPMVELTTTGDTEIQSATSMGFEWEPVSERFVAWNDGADVYVLNPPTGPWDTGTWVWGRVAPDPGNTEVPTRNPNGTYGRFRYAATVNAFLLVSAADGPVWAYRLTPGAGTGPNPQDGGVGLDAGADQDGGSPIDGGGGSPADAGRGPGTDGAADGTGGGSELSGSSGCGCASTTPRGSVAGVTLGVALLARRRRRGLQRG
jgi:hypothetical protein